MSPLHQIQRLIDDKRSVYFSAGLSSSVNGRIFLTIWGRPSDKALAIGYGETVEDAARDALSQVPDLEPVAATRPVLPGMSRPLLPGMTR